MKNIKSIIKQSGVRQYEIADYLHMQESNFSTKLRYPITPDFEKKILLAIATIQLERGTTNESIKGKE